MAPAVVVGKFGTATLTRDELLASFQEKPRILISLMDEGRNSCEHVEPSSSIEMARSWTRCISPRIFRKVRAIAGRWTKSRRAPTSWLVQRHRSPIKAASLVDVSPVDEYEAVNAELFRQLGGGIDAVYFCPEHPENATVRRKPGTGMLEEAKRDHQIAVEKSWFIGDKDTDVLCGRRAGCKTILVLTGYGKNYRDCWSAFHCAKTSSRRPQIVLAAKM